MIWRPVYASDPRVNITLGLMQCGYTLLPVKASCTYFSSSQGTRDPIFIKTKNDTVSLLCILRASTTSFTLTLTTRRNLFIGWTQPGQVVGKSTECASMGVTSRYHTIYFLCLFAIWHQSPVHLYSPVCIDWLFNLPSINLLFFFFYQFILIMMMTLFWHFFYSEDI